MIFFVGAGPGDPELITVKGMRLLQQADLILYTGSLVPEALLQYKKPTAETRNSASMALPEIIDCMERAYKAHKLVVRLHTGDPSLFGAITEQIAELEKRGIPYTVVPGVSSFLAGAAALKTELTLPEVSQTVIITRCEGQTPVPANESLEKLAAHQATMVLFLSVGLASKVQEKLLTAYPQETPVAIVEKVSWPEERIIRCQLKELAQTIELLNIQRTALIFVGKALSLEFLQAYSKLYDPSFSHHTRPATSNKATSNISTMEKNS